jgi:hypothetical protein
MTTMYEALFESGDVRVEKHLTEWEVYRVTPAGGRARTFKGESAWSDAERFAGDHDMQAWGCTN